MHNVQLMAENVLLLPSRKLVCAHAFVAQDKRESMKKSREIELTLELVFWYKVHCTEQLYKMCKETKVSLVFGKWLFNVTLFNFLCCECNCLFWFPSADLFLCYDCSLFIFAVHRSALMMWYLWLQYKMWNVLMHSLCLWTVLCVMLLTWWPWFMLILQRTLWSV